MAAEIATDNPALLFPAVIAPPLNVVRRSAWSRFRLWLLTEVVLQRWFDVTILVIIAANCVDLALDQPYDDPQSPKQIFVVGADKVRRQVVGCGGAVGGCWVTRRSTLCWTCVGGCPLKAACWP